MPAYIVPDATPAPQTLPTPAADAWVMPVGGNIRIADSDADLPRVGVIQSGVPYPITASRAGLRYVAEGAAKVAVRMWTRH